MGKYYPNGKKIIQFLKKKIKYLDLLEIPKIFSPIRWLENFFGILYLKFLLLILTSMISALFIILNKDLLTTSISGSSGKNLLIKIELYEKNR